MSKIAPKLVPAVKPATPSIGSLAAVLATLTAAANAAKNDEEVEILSDQTEVILDQLAATPARDLQEVTVKAAAVAGEFDLSPPVRAVFADIKRLAGERRSPAEAREDPGRALVAKWRAACDAHHRAWHESAQGQAYEAMASLEDDIIATATDDPAVILAKLEIWATHHGPLGADVEERAVASALRDMKALARGLN